MSDIRSILSFPQAFRFYQGLIGAGSARAFYAANFIKAAEGDRILDIGCGSADILDHLPVVRYTGFDMNPRYIDYARRRFGERGSFFCERVSGETAQREAGAYDIVLSNGVLHHLDDNEAARLFEIARVSLRKGGRLVTIDGCFQEGQSAIARYLLKKDRGKHVRTEAACRGLAASAFSDISIAIRHDLYRIPYTFIIMTCVK